MNTWNRFFRATLVAAFAFAFLAGTSSTNAVAQTVTLLGPEDFSSGVPPSNWNEPTGSWYQNSSGYNGEYAADCDDYDYFFETDGPLSTPSVDASSYASDQDSVWVDFDFFWEYNAYVSNGADTWQVLAGNEVIQSGTESDLYTWYNPNDYSWDNIQTDPSYWVHYHLLVPVADRTSALQLGFQVIPGWGCSNAAIDNVTITAFSVPPAEFSLQPKSLNFGSATPDSPDTLCVTASSIGVANLHITGVTLSGSSAYSIVNGPAVGDSIVSGNSGSFCIQFKPTASGLQSGMLSIATDARDSSTQTVSLTGIGAVPDVSYGVSSLFRGVAVPLGDTSGTLYIPVSSTGAGPLRINNIYFTGLNANDYFVSRFPTNPIQPGMNDSIGIRFAPTIEGRPDAHVVIASDAANLPSDTIPLFGVGTLPRLVITVPPPGTGNTVMFDSVALGDSVCQTITLMNPGTDTLRITNQVMTSRDYDFSFYALTGSDTMILPGASKLVNVCFKPLRSGTREATLRFYTNIPSTFEEPSRDTSQFQINITGVGVPYGHLTFNGQLIDTAEVGKSNCLTETLTNNGQADLTVSSVGITGPNASAFSLTGITTPFTLAAGQSQNVTLCFMPTARGVQFDTMLFAGSTADKSLSQAILLEGIGVSACVSADSVATFGITGMTAVGAMDTSCITVSNCGDIPATYTAAAPVGAAYTLLAPMTSAEIAPGGSTQFCVTFSPTSIGASNGSITITGGPNPVNVSLAGVGAGVAASAVNALNGPVAVGTRDTFAVTITNNGNIPWTPGTPTISGGNAADFEIAGVPTLSPTTIPAGGTGTLSISFCPSMAGPESIVLSFPGENPVPVSGAFTYTIDAIGAANSVTEKTAQDGFELGQSFPNPTNGATNLNVTLPHQAAVRIDLVDATGAFVRNAFSGTLAAGTQSIRIDAKGLAGGTYFFTMTSGDVQLSRQFIVIK